MKQERYKLGKSQRGFETVKQAVFGILCRRDKVFAEVVSGIKAKDLQPLPIKPVKNLYNKALWIISDVVF